jgi:hypothetical protein
MPTVSRVVVRPSVPARPSYLIGSWLIGAGLAMMFLVAFARPGEMISSRAGMIGYAALCTLLYPFARLVWDQLRAAGHAQDRHARKTWMLSAAVGLVPAILVHVILWSFAPFIGSAGLAWFRGRGDRA